MTGILTNLNRIIINRPLVFLFTLFLLVQTVLFLQTGVFTALEAEKYVRQGNLLFETGALGNTKYVFYLPVILLVYLCRLFGISYHFVVLIQVLLSGYSLFCFYHLGKNLSNEVVAFFSSTLLALFIPLQVWNFYLYSDSIFISLTIIYTWVVYRQGLKGITGAIAISLFLVLLIFSRPNGLLLVPPTIIYLLFRTQTKKELVFSCFFCAVLLTGMYMLLNTLFTGGEDMDAMKPFIEEHIICFVPLKPEGANLNIVQTSNPVNDIFYYIIHNPLHYSKFAVLKLFSFFNMTRSYYSPAHNILLAMILIPVYILALIGFFRFVKPFKNFTIFLVSLLILYPLAVTFQCDDWHSRFTMVVFPYILLLATKGLASLITRSKKKHELF